MKGWLNFGKPRAKNIAVVDIGSTSVGAAYATISGVAPPAIIYSNRIENVTQGVGAAGMLRALDAVGREMIAKGAPLLHTASGTGAIDQAIVLIGTPWQNTKLEITEIAKDKPFLFTEAMLQEAVKAKQAERGQTILIGSVLNGYETPSPVGKKASRAEIVLLSSFIDPETEPIMRRSLRAFLGSVPSRVITFPMLSLMVLRGLFPHETDFLAVRVGSDATDIVLVKRGHLSGVESAPCGSAGFEDTARDHGVPASAGTPGLAHDIIDRRKSTKLANRLLEKEHEWLAAMKEALIRAAGEGALPRVIFLFSEERSLSFFKRLLDAPELHALWLSDEPLSVLPVASHHFSSYMRHISDDSGDPILDMLSMLARIEQTEML